MPPDADEDAYDGYQDQQSAIFDNPHSPGFPGPRIGEGVDEEPNGHPPHIQLEEVARASFADNEDYGYNVGQRVLRVCPVFHPYLFDN